MVKKPLYRLEIAPLTVMGLTRSPFFSYLSREDVAPGSLVRIPFGRQRLQGIVFESHAFHGKLPDWMKYIERVEEPTFLTSHQRALALFLSESTLTPLGNCLKHFLVSKAKKPGVTKESVSLKKELGPLGSNERKVLRGLLKKDPFSKVLYSSEAKSKAPQEILLALFQEELSKKKQILYLVPEVLLAEWRSLEWEPYFSSKTLILIHSKLKGSELAHAWETIRNGGPAFVIGTRQALFAPFQNLSTIVVSDEEDETSYKQWEMSPRYRVREVAEELGRLHASRILFASPTPSLESILSIEKKKMEKFECSLFERAPLVSVNMRFEKKREKRAALSKPLVEAMSSVLREHAKIMLIGKQQGLSAFSICAHCRAVLRCPRCGKVLTGKKEGNFACLGCGYTSDLFPACQACGHTSFESYGVGTEKIEREVRKHFPYAKILRVDRSSLEKRSGLIGLVQDIRAGKFDILIGTHSLLKLPNLPKTSLIAMIEADSLLAFPEFRGEERLSRDIERTRLLAQKTAIVQTFEPERDLYSLWPKSPFLDIAKILMGEREALKYPPYTRFLKCECRGRSKKESEDRANQLAAALGEVIQEKKLPLVVIPPHLPLALSKQKNYQLLLRFPNDFPLPSSLIKILIRFSRNCIFDLDPLSLN
ncbi:MAG: primosomal protein N' [Candidatus Moraniibacteriota bacterium]